MSLKLWREPSTRTRGAAATISRSCSSVDGRCSVAARYAYVPAQFTSPTTPDQSSAPAGSTKRDGNRGSDSALEWSPDPYMPCFLVDATAVSGVPPCARIHVMTASKSAPSATIAARSMTVPPEGWARASRVTSSRIASWSTREP